MTNTDPPLFEPGQFIPVFTLPGADGMPHSPLDYIQRQNLILLFIHQTSSDETRGLLRAFAKGYSQIREEECSILAISPDTVLTNLHSYAELHLPFPLLADPKGEVFSRYTFWDSSAENLNPCIVLADRSNVLYQYWVAEREVDLPTIEELLDSLKYLNMLSTP